ncbi:MAG TPA: GtrA family protein [Candidatus Bathyarchaeia archaeon]|nr:GtrA family protein [Candidatus Bathyarchaeia archaeon]
MAIGQQRSSKASLFAKHAFMYYLVGGIGVLVNLGILYALKEYLGLWYLASSAIAIYVSMTTNFFLNKAWTFKDTMVKQSTLFMYFKFIAISVVGMLIQLGFNYIFVNNMQMYYIVAAFISIVIASGVNFVLNRKITFGIKL